MYWNITVTLHVFLLIVGLSLVGWGVMNQTVAWIFIGVVSVGSALWELWRNRHREHADSTRANTD